MPISWEAYASRGSFIVRAALCDPSLLYAAAARRARRARARTPTPTRDHHGDRDARPRRRPQTPTQTPTETPASPTSDARHQHADAVPLAGGDRRRDAHAPRHRARPRRRRPPRPPRTRKRTRSGKRAKNGKSAKGCVTTKSSTSTRGCDKAQPVAREEAARDTPVPTRPLTRSDGTPAPTNPGYSLASPRPGSRSACRTSSSTSSGSRRSCSRSTRPPACSTACAGRSWPRSTRSRPTTAAT